jgi:hypothetical protein
MLLPLRPNMGTFITKYIAKQGGDICAVYTKYGPTYP